LKPINADIKRYDKELKNLQRQHNGLTATVRKAVSGTHRLHHDVSGARASVLMKVWDKLDELNKKMHAEYLPSY